MRLRRIPNERTNDDEIKVTRGIIYIQKKEKDEIKKEKEIKEKANRTKMQNKQKSLINCTFLAIIISNGPEPLDTCVGAGLNLI